MRLVKEWKLIQLETLLKSPAWSDLTHAELLVDCMTIFAPYFLNKLINNYVSFSNYLAVV